MKYKAVIFDLFGTLTRVYSRQEWQECSLQMALALSMSANDFERLWQETSEARGRGEFPSIKANVEYIGQVLGIPLQETQLVFACRLRSAFIRNQLEPVAFAIEVLSRVKSSVIKTGLISNCAVDVPSVWRETRFAALIDAPIFSCSVGLRKPDERIYRLAAQQLGVKPEECLYLGDGDSHELTGAARVGMYPVLVRNPLENSADALRDNPDAPGQWQGQVISSLKEVLALLQKGK